MAPRIGRPEKYDWNELTDGTVWKAIQDEDFNSTLDGFRSLLQYHARKLGTSVEIHTRGQAVWFQFHKGGQAESERNH
jgi:hypothetical protein